MGQLTALAGGGYDSYWDRTYYTYVNALSGGEVDVGGAVSGHNVWTVDGAGSVLGVAGVSSLGGYVSVSVSGGNRVEFSSVASLGNTNLAASSGGQILFPVATSYTGYNWAHQTIQASGAGSRIDLGQLTALAGGGYDSYWDRTYYTYVNALSGGEVDVGGAVSGHNVWTVDGAGSVLGVAGITSIAGTSMTAANGAVWILPAGWHPAWGSGCMLTTSGTGSQFINRATLSLFGVTLTINTSAFTNQGILDAQNGGKFDFSGSFRVDDSGIITGTSGSLISISGDLTGNTTNADLYVPQAMVQFDGATGLAAPSAAGGYGARCRSRSSRVRQELRLRRAGPERQRYLRAACGPIRQRRRHGPRSRLRELPHRPRPGRRWTSTALTSTIAPRRSTGPLTPATVARSLWSLTAGRLSLVRQLRERSR